MIKVSISIVVTLRFHHGTNCAKYFLCSQASIDSERVEKSCFIRLPHFCIIQHTPNKLMLKYKDIPPEMNTSLTALHMRVTLSNLTKLNTGEYRFHTSALLCKLYEQTSIQRLNNSQNDRSQAQLERLLCRFFGNGKQNSCLHNCFDICASCAEEERKFTSVH